MGKHRPPYNEKEHLLPKVTEKPSRKARRSSLGAGTSGSGLAEISKSPSKGEILTHMGCARILTFRDPIPSATFSIKDSYLGEYSILGMGGCLTEGTRIFLTCPRP